MPATHYRFQTPWALATEHRRPSLEPVVTAGMGATLFAAPETRPYARHEHVALPPRSAPFQISPGRSLQAFDLPFAVRDDSLPVSIDLHESRNDLFELTGFVTLPKKKLLRQMDIERNRTSLDSKQRQQVQLYNFVDNLVGIMEDLRWAAETSARQDRDTAPLSWTVAYETLVRQQHDLRMDLICKIARQFDRLLFHLADNPRKILRKQRRKQYVSQVQQLDSACLTWLTQQPGKSALEKAGGRQRILAVARTEDYDTLENRVLKDMLMRCAHAARMFRYQNKEHAATPGYRLVLGFERRCRAALSGPTFAAIQMLPDLPHPNYVLQYHNVYRQMWRWYVKLVKRETTTLETWQWQNRLWADTVRLAIAGAISGLRGPRRHSLFVRNQHMWIREDQKLGNWLAPFDAPGPVVLRPDAATPQMSDAPDQTADEERTHTHRLRHPPMATNDVIIDTFIPTAMSPGPLFNLDLCRWAGTVGADFVLLFSSPAIDRNLCLFVWAIHSAADPATTEQLQQLCTNAAAALATFGKAAGPRTQLRGLVVRNDFQSEFQSLGDDMTTGSPNGAVAGIRLPGQPDEWSRAFVHWLQDRVIADSADAVAAK